MKKTIPFLIIGTVILGGIVLTQQNTFADANEIQQAEEVYFKAHGNYFQVLKHNEVPERYGNTTVEAELGKNVFDDATIDVYETPKGEMGYQLKYTENNNDYSIASGPEKNSREYIFSKSPSTIIATSTP